MEHDVVAIYDNAGIPSIMHRFKRTRDDEIVIASEDVHPAFVIGGQVYDEIYIGVYGGTMINGKIYSLPYTEPETCITMDEFAAACFAKGDGWHMMTAQEWGLLANISLVNGTLPHGNTKYGQYEDSDERGELISDRRKTLTGSGPATWTHDWTISGVHDLCGNVWEMLPGCRINNGRLEKTRGNDAALPETSIGENGKDWYPVQTDDGKDIYVSVGDEIEFTDMPVGRSERWDGKKWEDVKINVKSKEMEELALFAGEPNAYCYVDATSGEWCLYRGGYWYSGANAGVFTSNLNNPRSSTSTSIGGRCAYFQRKPKTGC
jgi:hypothetical protein